MNNTSKILAFAAAGAVAGGIMGVLFAPAKGSNSREKLANKAKKMASDMKSVAAETSERIQDFADETREFVKEKKSVFNPAIL